jgi:hypothetical protein
MAALGHLGPVEDAFGLVRGYRAQIAGSLRDLAQLKALYQERWESFLGFSPMPALFKAMRESGMVQPGYAGRAVNALSCGHSYRKFTCAKSLGTATGGGIRWLFTANRLSHVRPHLRRQNHRQSRCSLYMGCFFSDPSRIIAENWDDLVRTVASSRTAVPGW